MKNDEIISILSTNLKPKEPKETDKCRKALRIVARSLSTRPKPGRWLGDICSICGVSKYNWFSFNWAPDDYEGYARPFVQWNYCPGCGADMRGYLDEELHRLRDNLPKESERK